MCTFTSSWLVGAILAAVILAQVASCSGTAARPGDQSTRQPDIRLKDGRVLTEVALEMDDADQSLTLFYRTKVSLSECQGAQAEVREVWSQTLQSEADKRKARRVTVFPEDPSGRSQSFRFTRDQGEQWREENFLPCRS